MSGPWRHLPTHPAIPQLLGLMLPAGFRGERLPSVCDRELQVFHPFLWLHFAYFPGCPLSPVPPPRARRQPQRHLRCVCSGQLFLFLCWWSFCTVDTSQRVTAPGVHEGRVSGSADMAQALHSQGICPSDRWLSLGTAGRLAGLLHTLEAPTAFIPAEG